MRLRPWSSLANVLPYADNNLTTLFFMAVLAFPLETRVPFSFQGR